MTAVQVFAAHPQPLRNHVTILVTWHAVQEARLYCEAFLLSAKAPSSLAGQRFTLPTSVLLPAKEGAQHVFLESEAMRWVIGELEETLLGWILQQPPGPAVRTNVRLEHLGERAIGWLWACGRLDAAIDRLERSTLSDEFREQLRQARCLPRMEQSDVDDQTGRDS